ncbi:MAG: translation elongation factor Ts [Gammaproteobacteria bacterium]
MAITAGLVKELRERTGAGMMECKKALVDADGDIEKAIETMRKAGQAKADRKAGRTAAEGLIAIALDSQHQRAAMVEVNCETDFVAKEDGFQAFAAQVATQALGVRPATLEALLNTRLEATQAATIEERRQQLVARIGENISVRRWVSLESARGQVGSYLHGGRIGVLVAINGGDERLAKDVAMHIAASRPVCIAEGEIPADLLAKEREIFTAQAASTDKPPQIVEKMVAGRLKKFVAEVTLHGQPFVKDPDITVATLLAEHEAVVEGFQRYEVGEGLEKNTEDFAGEVMAQIKARPDSIPAPNDPNAPPR